MPARDSRWEAFGDQEPGPPVRAGDPVLAPEAIVPRRDGRFARLAHPLAILGIIPNAINRSINFSLDVWDADWPDDDDHLGYLYATLNAANAWGLRGNPLGADEQRQLR